MYRAIADFADMQDGGYVYHAGDKFPRDGVEADPARIATLLTNTNRLQKPLIEYVYVISMDSPKTVRGRKKKPEENEV